MKPTETAVSKSLEEVWKWKNSVYDDIKDMSLDETKIYLHEGLTRAAETIGARLVKNPDGTYSFV